MADLAKAGKIVLLVGSILAVLGAIIMLAMALLLGQLVALDPDAGEEVAAFIGPLYIGLALVTLLGAILGFIGFAKASRGENRTAAILAFVATALPPVQVVFLVAGLLLILSDS